MKRPAMASAASSSGATPPANGRQASLMGTRRSRTTMPVAPGSMRSYGTDTVAPDTKPRRRAMPVTKGVCTFSSLEP